MGLLEELSYNRLGSLSVIEHMFDEYGIGVDQYGIGVGLSDWGLSGESFEDQRLIDLAFAVTCRHLADGWDTPDRDVLQPTWSRFW